MRSVYLSARSAQHVCQKEKHHFFHVFFFMPFAHFFLAFFTVVAKKQNTLKLWRGLATFFLDLRPSDTTCDFCHSHIFSLRLGFLGMQNNEHRAFAIKSETSVKNGRSRNFCAVRVSKFAGPAHPNPESKPSPIHCRKNHKCDHTAWGRNNVFPVILVKWIHGQTSQDKLRKQANAWVHLQHLQKIAETRWVLESWGWLIPWKLRITSSAAQGGGGSFKNRKPIGEAGCCESRMAERIHWWTERWLVVFFGMVTIYNGCSGHLVGHLTHNCWLDVVWCSVAVVVIVV